MLNNILSISGKPGLFKLVSRGKNMLIVESLLNGKRMPAYSHDKVISLADIAMFTQDGEEPLAKVMDAVKKVENGAIVSLSSKATSEELRNWFGTILPDFDRERVYPSDIKKLISWYNILTESNNNDFLAETKEVEETQE
ncbi:MAG: DUF5606 domain-containing protein [Bacteroidales bacterium]|nr:DUF5606 domain-containing protein [Bacteroidales bacterium]